MSPSEAFQALNLLLGWSAPWIPVYEDETGRTAALWHRADGKHASAVLASLCDRRGSAWIGPGQRRPEGGGPTACTILWARIEGKLQEQRAMAFKPVPTLVLRDGDTTRRLLIWALRSPVAYEGVFQANRKIAYRLGAKQKDGRPELLRIAAPDQPAGRGVVKATRVSINTYSVKDVVGRLKEPPEPKWERRAA